jgi:predicted transcriptional regulator
MMKLKNIVETLELNVFTGDHLLDREITGGYVSDLLSDVMGHASEGECWITLQSHMNVVAIASLKELSAILLVKNIQADEKVLKKAQEEEIPVLGTSDSTFIVAGKLFNLLA